MNFTRSTEPYSGWAFSGLFMDGRRGGGGKKTLPEIYHTYPIIMKLGTNILHPNSGVAKLNEPANCDTKLNFCMNTA